MKKILAVTLAVILLFLFLLRQLRRPPRAAYASKVEKDLYWVGFMADGGVMGFVMAMAVSAVPVVIRKKK